MRYLKSMLNCWEYMQCGREAGGKKVVEFGVCPAFTQSSFDGVNRGRNGGRCCWKIAGTYCGGFVQGEMASKIITCVECDFFKKVLAEEGGNFSCLA